MQLESRNALCPSLRLPPPIDSLPHSKDSIPIFTYGRRCPNFSKKRHRLFFAAEITSNGYVFTHYAHLRLYPSTLQYPVLFHRFRQVYLPDRIPADIRIHRITCSDLYRTGSCQHHFDHLFRTWRSRRSRPQESSLHHTPDIPSEVLPGKSPSHEKPPILLAITGLFVFRSIRIPGSVFTREMPSAPAFRRLSPSS